MKMKLILAMAMLSFAIASQAQEVKPSSKFGMELQQHLAQNVKRTKVVTRSAAPETQKVKVLVSLVPTSGVTAADLEAVGCEVKFAMKSVASVIVPVDKLEALAAIEGVRNINLPRKAELENDLSRSVVFVDDVVDPKKAVAAGLPQEYDGTGVLVGIIDNGIDFRHYAFRDEKGNPRFERVFLEHVDTVLQVAVDSVRNSLTGEMEYKYEDSLVCKMKTLYTPEEILKAEPVNLEHGSHVLGILAGQEVAGNNLQGMAPKAGIVAVDVASLADDVLIESMKSLCEYAEEVKKPIAINMSLGGYGGWPDGCDPVSAAIIELTDNGTKPGVIFSLSAGNHGAEEKWVTHTFTSDDEKLFVICDTLKYPDSTPVLGHKVRSLYKVESVRAWTNRVVDNWEDVLVFFDRYKKTLINDPDAEVGVATLYQYEENGKTVYHLNPKSKMDEPLRKVVTLRELRELHKEVDAFSNSLHTCMDGVTQKTMMWFRIVNSSFKPFENLFLGSCFSFPAGTELLVGSFTNDDFGTFIKPEGFDCAKVGSCSGTTNLNACNAACIATGNYVIRNTFKNTFGYETSEPDHVVNEVAPKSAYGYTFNEHHYAKPEVLAPGSYIQSAANNYYTSSFPGGYGVLKTDLFEDQKQKLKMSTKATVDGQDYWYQYQAGTSMAAPVTTGIVALWLQANPNLSVADVRDILEKTSTRFTSSIYEDKLKSSRFGLINALEGLKYINAHMTGISNIAQDSQKNADSRIFSLDGREVKGKPSSGIYVQNGKKFVIK